MCIMSCESWSGCVCCVQHVVSAACSVQYDCYALLIYIVSCKSWCGCVCCMQHGVSAACNMQYWLLCTPDVYNVLWKLIWLCLLYAAWCFCCLQHAAWLLCTPDVYNVLWRLIWLFLLHAAWSVTAMSSWCVMSPWSVTAVHSWCVMSSTSWSGWVCCIQHGAWPLLVPGI